MFAVPGWSVPAESLKTQVNTNPVQPSQKDPSQATNGAEKRSRKRKRGHGVAKGLEVTEENLDDLWKTHIEKASSTTRKSEVDGDTKEAGGKIKKKRKRKLEEKAAVENAQNVNGDIQDGLSGEKKEVEKTEGEDGLVKKKKKRKRKDKTQDDHDLGKENNPDAADLTKPEHADQPLVDSKTKYEERKAKSAQKRARKAQQQADGTLPPTRPNPTTTLPTETNNTKLSTPPKKPAKRERRYPSLAALGKDPLVLPSPIQPTPANPLTAPPSISSSALTPLQQRMAAKLTSARFRHLNQTLYTTPSHEAVQLFSDPQAYTSYHAGFRAQVALWPQNPVEGFITDLKDRGAVRIPSQKKLFRDKKRGKKPKSDTASANAQGVDPLPRSKHGVCTIADLGCGDAQLSSSLQPLKTNLNLKILSFDLAKGDSPAAKLITVADITNLRAAGVQDGSVDVAICCLSLMGTNWVDVVEECARVVRGGGEVWVAEIKSRFSKPGQVKGKKEGDGIGKKKSKKDTDEDPADLIEVEEEPTTTTKPPQKEETDVSAFVEVFRKRGFNLKGEADLSNKMFVKMRFFKTVGGRVEQAAPGENERGGAARFGDGFKGKQKRFLDEVVEGEGEVDEGRVLKPCVYKIR